jgi:hypothetical protein
MRRESGGRVEVGPSRLRETWPPASDWLQSFGFTAPNVSCCREPTLGFGPGARGLLEVGTRCRPA